VASSGIAAILLTGGWSAHSAFELPLNMQHKKSTDEACVLQKAELFIWDECTMSHRHALGALDRTLKDIKGNQSDLEGITLLLFGYFRQTLPIIPRGILADELAACLKSSFLWQHVQRLQLSTNMRVQL
jgi:hypothetical protein